MYGLGVVVLKSGIYIVCGVRCDRGQSCYDEVACEKEREMAEQ